MGLGRTSVFAHPITNTTTPNAYSLRDQLQDQSGSYLPRLVAVLWTIFDPIQGPKVVAQVPEGSVATALSTFPRVQSEESIADKEVEPLPNENNLAALNHLFEWSSVMDFVIPKADLCGYLVTKATRTCKILGFPVQIVDEEKYHKGNNEVFNRNTFTFNLCFVFERDAELSVFEPLVRKIGRTLRSMEESISLLSSPPPTFNITDLIETLYMDINAFSESSILLHDTDLDLMLFPFYKNPKEVMAWDVPVWIAEVEGMKKSSWDVTLFKVCGFINGVYPVRRIAELAEVDLHLARLCIQHLLFYGAIILVDLFQFTNVYVPLRGIAEIAQFGEEEDEGLTDLRTELVNYVHTSSSASDSPPVPFPTLLSLYSKLNGVSVGNWIDQNDLDGYEIDVRRMIQFGVIKGFLRRVRCYPYWLGSEESGKKRRRRRKDQGPPEAGRTKEEEEGRPDFSRQTSSAFSTTSSYLSSSFSTHTHSTTSAPPSKDAPAPPLERTALLTSPLSPQNGNGPNYPASLLGMLDGVHDTDEICVKYGMSRRYLGEVLDWISGGGEEEGETEEKKEKVVLIYV